MEKQLGLEKPISEYLGYCDFELCKKSNIVLPTEDGIIYDISDLLLNDQQAFVNNFLEMFWLYRKVNIEWKKQAIIILEESELYCQYLNSKTTQQILKF